MPDISFYCTFCGQHLDAPDDMAGTEADCPACSRSMVVPGETQASAATSRMRGDARVFVLTTATAMASIAMAVLVALALREKPPEAFTGCNLCWRQRAAMQLDSARWRLLSPPAEEETRTPEKVCMLWKNVESWNVEFRKWDENVRKYGHLHSAAREQPEAQGRKAGRKYMIFCSPLDRLERCAWMFGIPPAAMLLGLLGVGIRRRKVDAPSDDLRWWAERVAACSLVLGSALLFLAVWHYEEKSVVHADVGTVRAYLLMRDTVPQVAFFCIVTLAGLIAAMVLKTMEKRR